MLIGLMLCGMLVGATTASYWVLTGGSILSAIALYSLVAVAFVLGSAVLSYVWSDPETSLDDDQLEALPAAE